MNGLQVQRSADPTVTVVLGIEVPDVAEEVLHLLDRGGAARVVATGEDDRQLVSAARQLEPEVAVVSPSIALGMGAAGVPLLVVDTRETVSGLRAAVAAGADGFFVWPDERDALARAVRAAAARRPILDAGRRGSIVAVHAARGGAGATFVATHLTAAFARQGASAILIDADPVFGDVGAALAVPDEEVRTIADLLSLGDELSPTHLDEALWTHAEGFRVLLAPPPEAAGRVHGEDIARVAEVASRMAEAVVVHLARAVDDRTIAAIDIADRVLEVLALDVASFRAGMRVVEALGPPDLDGRLAFVVNRAARGEIVPADVARVFGDEPVATFPFDRAVPRAQDRGRLLPARGRIGRGFERLARALAPTDEPAVSGAAAERPRSGGGQTSADARADHGVMPPPPQVLSGR